MTNAQDDPDQGNRDYDRLANIRVAAMLRKTGSMQFDASSERELAAVARELGVSRSDVIRLALREWLAKREKMALK